LEEALQTVPCNEDSDLFIVKVKKEEQVVNSKTYSISDWKADDKP